MRANQPLKRKLVINSPSKRCNLEAIFDPFERGKQDKQRV